MFLAAIKLHLVSGGVVFQRALRPAMHILNKVFDSDITLLLLASFVTAVDNSSSYEPTALSFLYFLALCI